MKMSRRARRMERHHKKHKNTVSLNLVSLMDIFTILVFFLLVNSTDVETLPSTKLVTLPESLSEMQPRQTITIIVTPENIMVQGRVVLSTQDLEDTAGVIPELSEALKESLETQFKGVRLVSAEATVMADRHIPFKILKRVMLSCSKAKFTKVSLAVMQDVADDIK